MTEDDPGYEIARNSDHTVTDCMMRAMTDFGDLVEKVVVITMDKDGSTVCLYSNAHSDPEMMGMMYSSATQPPADWVWLRRGRRGRRLNGASNPSSPRQRVS